MQNKQRVSSADLVRNFGVWQERALVAPVYITHHKRDRLVLTSLEDFLENKSKKPAVASASDTAALKSVDGAPVLSKTSIELSALLDNIGEAYVVLDHDLVITQMNRRQEALWGVDRSQAIGKPVHSFFPAVKTTAVLAEKLRRCLKTREPESMDFQPPSAPHLNLHLSIYSHPDGVAVLHTNRTEITDLRNAAAEVESLNLTIERHPHIAHARTNAQGKFVYSDDTFRLWTGFDETTLNSSRLADITIAADRRRVNEAFADVMTSHGQSALATRIVGKNFVEHDVFIALAPIMTEANASGVTIIATIIASEPAAAAGAKMLTPS